METCVATFNFAFASFFFFFFKKTDNGALHSI